MDFSDEEGELPMPSVISEASRLIQRGRANVSKGNLAVAKDLFYQAYEILRRANITDVHLKTQLDDLARQLLPRGPAPGSEPFTPEPSRELFPQTPIRRATSATSDSNVSMESEGNEEHKDAAPVDLEALLATGTSFIGNFSGLSELQKNKLKSTLIRPKTEWTSIVGYTATKTQLKTYAEKYLARESEKGMGILFTGPPGTGKTKFAEAFATASGCLFISVGPDTLQGGFVGDSSLQARAILDLAKNLQSVVLFLDELDALAPPASAGTSSADQAYRGATTVLQVGIQRLLEETRITIIGATNYKKNVEAAIVSRLSNEIQVPAPDTETRFELFKFYLKDYTTQSPYLSDFDFWGFASDDVSGGLVGRTIGALSKEIPNLSENVFRASKWFMFTERGRLTPVPLIGNMLPCSNCENAQRQVEALEENIRGDSNKKISEYSVPQRQSLRMVCEFCKSVFVPYSYLTIPREDSEYPRLEVKDFYNLIFSKRTFA